MIIVLYILHDNMFENKKINKIIDYQKFFNDKIILVTGSSGLIGTDLVINL